MKRTLAPLVVLSAALAIGASAAAQTSPAKAPAPQKPAAEKPAADKKEAVDPICGMTVKTDAAAAKATYQGKTYYFCSKGEKATFEKDPAKYVKK